MHNHGTPVYGTARGGKGSKKGTKRGGRGRKR